MIGPDQLARTDQRRLEPRLALAHVALDVFDHHDRVVDHESNRQHDSEDREQVQAEAERVHDDSRTDQRNGHRHQRNQRGAHRAHEQEDHQRDDRDGLGQGLADFGQGVAHEHRAVPDQAHLDVLGQRRANPLHRLAQPSCHFELVGAGNRPHAEVDALLRVVLGDELRLFGPELDARHIGQADDRAVAIGDDQLLELVDGAQIGVGEQVDLDEVALGLADRSEIVVALERRLQIAGRQPQCGEAIRIDPHAHRNVAPALVVADALNAFDRRKLRLHGAQQVIGDRGDAALARVEAQVERRVRPIRALHLDRRRLRLGRQLGAHLLQPGRDLCQRRGAVMVELEVNGDRAHAGTAGRLDMVHAADRRHGAFDGRGEEAAHGFRAGPGVDGGDHHRGALKVRVLLDRQRHQRPRSDQHDHEIDDHREDGVLDEDVGERAHGFRTSCESREGIVSYRRPRGSAVACRRPRSRPAPRRAA